MKNIWKTNLQYLIQLLFFMCHYTLSSFTYFTKAGSLLLFTLHTLIYDVSTAFCWYKALNPPPNFILSSITMCVLTFLLQHQCLLTYSVSPFVFICFIVSLLSACMLLHLYIVDVQKIQSLSIYKVMYLFLYLYCCDIWFPAWGQ